MAVETASSSCITIVSEKNPTKYTVFVKMLFFSVKDKFPEMKELLSLTH